ncbi:hypothetical protein [Paucidesulfovibrio longus]|uniref:hypothetical protein n=1 Tax=Paucidesulfovibrio longus TaxID=889 RepID=UPI0003B3ABF4|nr:hypothetical protein [Paucidesulfovibrio longus]
MNRRRIILSFLGALLLAAAFAFGLASAAYNTPLFRAIVEIKRSILPEDFGTRSWAEGASNPQQIVLPLLFDEPLPAVPLLLAPVRSMDDLAARIDEMRLVTSESFLDGPSLRIEDAEALADDVLRLRFRCDGRPHEAYAYHLPPTGGASRGGVLIIPGSGDDQAWEIRRGNGYHGDVASYLRQWFDVYVLIKPNHGARAIHDGVKRYSRYVFVPGLLNDGYPYSATHITEAMAFLQLIRAHHPLVGCVGLSQGGEATLIATLLSHPDFAVVASGYSTLLRRMPLDNIGQIIIPDLWNKLLAPERVRAILLQGKTRMLFSWGKQEGYPYGSECLTHASQNALRLDGDPRITFTYHEGEHVFPFSEMTPFLQGVIAARDKGE